MAAQGSFHISALLCAALMAAFSGTGMASPISPTARRPATGPAGASTYRLGVGDQLRVVTFDEPTLSGDFAVNSAGAISFPLVGDVKAANLTSDQVAAELTRKLADGYLKAPKVSIEVIGFRPIYVLGEVNKPGEYPYAPGMTVMTAVATAQGFTYRAEEKHVLIRAENQAVPRRVQLGGTVLVEPGDVIRVGERYF